MQWTDDTEMGCGYLQQRFVKVAKLSVKLNLKFQTNEQYFFYLFKGFRINANPSFVVRLWNKTIDSVTSATLPQKWCTRLRSGSLSSTNIVFHLRLDGTKKFAVGKTPQK